MTGSNHISQYQPPAIPVKTGTYEDGRPQYTFYTPPAEATGPTFNVGDYGATGDGVTDDTAAIQKALYAAQSAGGGVVLLPPGRYVTSATLVIPASNITLQGQGMGSVVYPISGAQFDVISTPIPPAQGTAGYSPSSVGVVGLLIDGSRMTGTTAGAGNAVHFYGASGSHVRDCWMTSVPNWCVLLDGDSTNYGACNDVTRCTFDLSAAGVFLTNSEANFIRDNVFKYAKSATAAAQPAFGGQSTTAAHLLCASGDHLISGNVLGQSGTYTTAAVWLQNSGGSRVIGNRFDSVRYQAVLCSADNQTIIGNQLSSPNSVGGGFGIELGSQHNTIIGNHFENAVGINYSYAIGESGAFTHNGNRIIGNSLLAGVTGVLSLQAASFDQVAHNEGYNPVGHFSSQPAIPASGTAYTNNFSVDATVYVTGGTVTAIAVGGTATGATSGAFRVAAGQTITLTYSATPSWAWFGD